MQNEKLSTFTKSKTISKNLNSTSNPETQNKAQINEQSLKSLQIESKKKNRASSPKKRKRKRQKPISSLIRRLFRPEIFFKDDKIKSKFLNFFNIKELIILLDVNSTFFEVIFEFECFKKYLKLRNEFILKESIYEKILLSNNEEAINYSSLKNKKNSPEIKPKNTNYLNNTNLINNSKISQSRIYHEKFNVKGNKAPVKLGLNNVLTIYPTLAGENEKNEKDEELKKNNIYNKLLDDLNNKDKDINKINTINEIKKNLFPPLDYKKFEINSLLRNNAEKIKKLSKKYNLTQIETKIIFNGMIEHLIFMNDIIEANDLHPIIITDLKASNNFNYYIESLLNIDFDEIAKINFDNVILNSIPVMKTLSFILYKYSYCLKILILSNNKIDDKCSKLLFPSLQENKVLSILDLSNNCISNEGIAFGELFFIDNRSMTITLFDNNILGPIGVFNLCKFLRNNQKMNINMLDLGYNGITKEGIIHLVNYIRNNKNKINKLYIGGNYLCDDGLEILSNIFERVNIVKQKAQEEIKEETNDENIKDIDNDNKNIYNSTKIINYINNNNKDNKNIYNSTKIISNNDNNKDKKNIYISTKIINSNDNPINTVHSTKKNSKNNSTNNISNPINAFQNNLNENNINGNNNKITFLDIQNNNLTKKSSKYLCNIVSSNNPDVTELIVSNNNLGNETILKIVDCIKTNNKLLSLDISQTQIDEKSIKYISEKLNIENLLEKLILSKNDLKKSCEYIKNLLIKKTNIKYLKITSCKIENNFNLIFQGLAQNKMLQILDMSNNNLSLNQDLFEDIIDALKKNNTLIKIKLNETNIDDISVEYITKGLKENKALRKLYMKNNYLTKKSVKMIIKSIENNDNNILSKIEVSGNDGINNKSLEEIERVLQNKKDNASEYNSELDIPFLDYNKKYDDNIKDIF